MSPYHWGEFHVAPSMGSIVSVVNLQDRQIHSKIADQSIKPGNGTV